MKAILILVDSVCRRFLKCYGSTEPAFTPNLDRLAARGTVFENHWCGSAPCMPARRDLMTGRLNFLEKPWGGIEPFDQPLPKMLASEGVFSHIVTDHYHYIRIGGENYLNAFTTYDLVRGQEKDPWRLHPRANGKLPEKPEGYIGQFSAAHEDNMTAFTEEQTYPTPVTMQKAADWLEQNAEADNFFLWAEGFDPHEPFDVPQKYLDLYADEAKVDEGEQNYWAPYAPNTFTEEQTKHLRVRYKALLSMTDAYIGKIFDVLDRKNLWDDTMVIFTTDHGYMLGEHGYWSKNYMPAYNEVFRLPLLIWHPNATQKHVDAMTQNIDLYPTLLNLFGVNPSILHHTIHGKTLLPLLAGEADKARDAVLYGYFGKSVNCFDGQYTYFRAAAREDNRPLNVYTAMPATSGKYYGIDSIDPEEYKKIGFANLSWTEYPVYRIPAEIVNITASSGGFGPRSADNADSRIYDLQNDPAQEHPIKDDELEDRLKNTLIGLMQSHDAPLEQYERLGL